MKRDIVVDTGRGLVLVGSRREARRVQQQLEVERDAAAKRGERRRFIIAGLLLVTSAAALLAIAEGWV